MTPEQSTAYKQIQELKSRYCRLMDTKQWPQWRNVFCDDIVMDVSDDVPPELGNAITTGLDTVETQLRSFVGDAITVHQVHAPEIELTSATTAKGIWAMSDVVIWPEGVTQPIPGVGSIHGFGHYHEDYKLVDGEWKIAKLKLTRLHIIPNM